MLVGTLHTISPLFHRRAQCQSSVGQRSLPSSWPRPTASLTPASPLPSRRAGTRPHTVQHFEFNWNMNSNGLGISLVHFSITQPRLQMMTKKVFGSLTRAPADPDPGCHHSCRLPGFDPHRCRPQPKGSAGICGGWGPPPCHVWIQEVRIGGTPIWINPSKRTIFRKCSPNTNKNKTIPPFVFEM